ncbi:MAG: TIGR00730 family Rossman fold protein [Archangium sp.]
MKRVCVFCGSKPGNSPVFQDAARALGKALGVRGLELVYGGAHTGLMGAVADGALEAGAKVIGVIPDGLARQEFAHPRITDVRKVATMSERKDLMGELSDAFIALPGGFGTMDELFEVLTGAQIGLHQKPIGVLNTLGFYDSITNWISTGLQRGFIPGGLKDVLVVHSEPEVLVETLLSHQPPPPAVQWIKR